MEEGRSITLETWRSQQKITSAKGRIAKELGNFKQYGYKEQDGIRAHWSSTEFNGIQRFILTMYYRCIQRASDRVFVFWKERSVHVELIFEGVGGINNRGGIFFFMVTELVGRTVCVFSCFVT